MSDAIDLHYDWIYPEHHQNRDDHHDHVILFLHGLLGNGRNLRTMAKKVCESSQHPGLLLDIRGHGQSKMPSNSPLAASTTTFASCVRDVQHTLQNIPQVPPDATITLVGHSLGGRISLQFAHDSMFNNTATTTTTKNQSQHPIHQVWLLDTVPGQANDSVERVVSAVTKIASQSDITSRKELVQQLTNEPFKIDIGTAQWLASSLQPKGGNGQTLEFNFDLKVVHDLLADFHNQSFMNLLEGVLRGKDEQQHSIRVNLVRGGKNQGWNETNLSPLRSLESQYPNKFSMHLLANAGHWVHVDDLTGLLNIMDVSK